MPDYLHNIEFGLFCSPDVRRLNSTLELAQLAEVSGLDLVSIQDHPYQERHLDTWTLLSVIGAHTSAVRLAPNVACLPLRPPVGLAKAAATLDLATSGRVELGLGAGAFWDAIAQAGGPRRSPGEAVDALVEAIQIIRACWAGDTVDVDGRHYQVRGLKAGPVPAHRIPIWLGAYKPRMLRITGELADSWIPSMGFADPPQLRDLNERIDEAATAAGRDPSSIRRRYNVFGRFGTGNGFLQGKPGDWAEQLAGLALSEGMSTFILGTDNPEDVRRFAGEVAPAVRDLVAVARTAPQLPGVSASSPAGESPTAATTPTASPAPAPDSTPARKPTGIAVSPTPDDGDRLGEMPWDESSRPSLPAPEGMSYTAQQEAMPQHLIDVHDHLRAELTQVRSIVDQVRQGALPVGSARSVIAAMTIRQNNWTLGAYCESYCRVVTGHHTLEDRSIFPHLRRAQPDLAAVLDQLEEEHEVIADVLDRLDRALVALVDDARAGHAALAELGRVVDLLTDTLLSHLAYEERELLHPLARFGFG